MKKEPKKKCDFCGKSYKECAEVVTFHGKFCLHDDKLKMFKLLQGQPMANTSISVKVAKDGKDSSETKYIDKASRSGDTVVRGSDGLLRRITKTK